MKRFSSAFTSVAKNPTTRLLTIAGSLRHFSDAILVFFLPAFFMKTYPAYKLQYAALNALALTVCGFSSNLLAGIIGDKYEKRNPMTKGWITCLSCLLTVPLMAIITGSHGNFWVAMAANAAGIFCAGSYHSTAVTMIQNSVSS